MNFCKQLGASGELVLAEGQSFPDQARLVCASKDATPITDGYSPKARSFLPIT